MPSALESCCGRSECYRRFGHLLFGSVRILRQFSDDRPVIIAAVIIHPSERCGGIAGERGVNDAYGLEQFLPLAVADDPKTIQQYGQRYAGFGRWR